jgi:2,3-bisphosphoglycerate-dependent phosphoglycerate mutase
MEGMSGEEIIKRELETGVPIVYTLNADTRIATHAELKN